MNYKKKIVSTLWVLGLVSLLTVSSLHAAQTIGPEGGDVRTLAYDPQNPDHVILSTATGQMFSSNDGGKSWSRFARIGENDYVLDHIYFDPNDSSVIYVAAWSITNEGGELFRTEDGGRSWSSMKEMKGKSIRALAIAPSNSKIMVAGTLDGVYRSDDAGRKWARIAPESLHNLQSVAIDPKDPNVIYAGTRRLAYKTTDGGQSWAKLARGMDEDSDVFSIAIDPKTPANVYASACTGVYLSNNGGQLFRKVSVIPESSRRVRVIKQDPSNPKVIYAGSTTGLWKSLDGGIMWHRVSAANLIINDVMIDPRNSKHVLLATDRSGVMASNDGALTFASSNAGFTHREIRTILLDKSQAETMYVGVVNDKEFGGAFLSADGGSHWSKLNSGLNGSDVFVLAQDANNRLIAGTNNGLFRMEPATQMWTRMFTTATWRPTVSDLRIEGDNWFAGTSSGLLYSHDAGRSWQILHSTDKEPFTMVRSSGNRIAAAGYRELLTSHDNGRSWAEMPSPSVSVITGMVLDQNERLWVSSPEGLFHEKAVGGWQTVKTDLPESNITNMTYDPQMHRMYVVTASNEVFASTDGQGWSSVYEGGYAVQTVVPAPNTLLVVTKYDGIVSYNSKDLNAKLTAANTR